MDWSPSYKLYASDGITLIYTFQYITEDNSPQDPFYQVEITGIRGQGSLIVEGSVASWDLNLGFWLIGNNYQDLIAKMDTLQSTVAPNTSYILKIDRTPSTSQSYHVKRIVPIQWQSSGRYYSQKGNLILRVNAW